jgi:hypothetical protein
MSEVLTRAYRDGGDLHVLRWQDCEDIIDRNKAKQAHGAHKSDFWSEIAEIPNVIIEQWLNEERRRGNLTLRLYSNEFDALVARKLRDPDWRWLRTDNPSSPFRMGWGK